MCPKVSNQLVGAAGVLLVGSCVVKDLKWIFREQVMHDFGIDAMIEVVKTGEVSGRLVALQM